MGKQMDKLIEKIQPEYVSDIPEVEQAIKQLFLDVIGENEPITRKILGGTKPNYSQIMARNNLRKKLRDEVEQL